VVDSSCPAARTVPTYCTSAHQGRAIHTDGFFATTPSRPPKHIHSRRSRPSPSPGRGSWTWVPEQARSRRGRPPSPCPAPGCRNYQVDPRQIGCFVRRVRFSADDASEHPIAHDSRTFFRDDLEIFFTRLPVSHPRYDPSLLAEAVIDELVTRVPYIPEVDLCHRIGCAHPLDDLLAGRQSGGS